MSVDPALLDFVLPEDEQGYPEAEMLADREPGVLFGACGAASRAFPKALWIEPGPSFRNWKEKAAENTRNRTWGRNFCDRFTNQQPTHECTCHSLSRNFESARNRARAVIYRDGAKKDFRYPESGTVGSVWVSPLSVYAEANPRQWGGAGVRQVLEIACRRGMLPDKIQPHEYGFKHSMQGTTGKGNKNQSSGMWVPLSRFPDGWQETGKLLMPEEVIFPESWEQAMCLLLHSGIVSVGRNGHAVPWGEIDFDREVIPYDDSYDVTRYDSFRLSKSSWQGSFCIWSTTTPDDWMKPAA